MLVIETATPGGQAGSSSKIENYLGFPDGTFRAGTGRARNRSDGEIRSQDDGGAQRSAAGLRQDDPIKLSWTTATSSRRAPSSSPPGAQYNKPRIANMEKFEGQGIYYGATSWSRNCAERKT